MPLLSSCNCYDEVTRQEQLLELRTCVYTLECFVEACVCFLAAFFLEHCRPGVALGVTDRE